MRPLKSLTLEAIVDLLATTFGAVDDPRAAEQLSYPLHDTLMSGFAVMFFQHASLLQFQRAMEKKRRRCNLQTMFGVHEVPSDTQMREILDEVQPESLRSVLPQLWEKVRRAGWGGRFTTTLPSGQHQGTYYTVALDGSEYFFDPDSVSALSAPDRSPGPGALFPQDRGGDGRAGGVASSRAAGCGRSAQCHSGEYAARL